MKIKRCALSLFAASALLALCTPVAAVAATHSRGACIEEAIPSGSDAQPAMRCFATFAAAIHNATHDRVNLPADTVAGSVTPDQLDHARAAANTTYVLSIDYKNTNYTGNSLTWYGKAKCGSYYAKTMPAGWDNVVQSVRLYSGCANTLYWNKNFGQPQHALSLHVDASVGNLGTSNKQASSEKWCSAYPCR